MWTGCVVQESSTNRTHKAGIAPLALELTSSTTSATVCRMTIEELSLFDWLHELELIGEYMVCFLLKNMKYVLFGNQEF